jgi:SAM-dependent methyltransferase
MKDLAVSSQPEEYLDTLLQYLACPVNNSAALTAIRNPAGKIVSLRSDDREYPVVNNVPRMMPDLGERKSRAWRLWEELLTKWWTAFGNPPEKEPSVEDDPVTSYVGRLIGWSGRGLFLDIGCGTSSLPLYMEASGEAVEWIGIDPALGDVARRFPFVQGLGEYLPFRTEVFDGALYSLVLSNLLDPLQAMRQARRALKPGGRVYVKYYVTRVDARYVVWKTMRTLGLAWRYNEFYQWVFTNRSVQVLLSRAGFAVEKVMLLCEICPYRAKCEDVGTEFLATGQRI